jgi:hypothetical protein
MSRNGSGTYSLPAGNPVVSGTTVTTTWANTTLNDIASSLTGSVAADGQTPMTGALNMANNKITAVTDPTSAQDAATKAYVDANVPSTANFLTKTNNLSDVSNATTSRTNLGLGTIATQAANAVAITGGAINGTTVGTTTPSTVKTTGLTVTGATSGTLDIAATAVAGTNTATFPAATGTVMVSGNMPAFSAYKSASQTLTHNTNTLVTFDTESYDTNNNFASNRFTPTVAGYYQVCCVIDYQGTFNRSYFFSNMLYKNGATVKSTSASLVMGNGGEVSVINNPPPIYMNGTTDYLEIYTYVFDYTAATSTTINGTALYTSFGAYLVRTA